VAWVVGSQSISKVEPAGMLVPLGGEVIASKPLVWATTAAAKASREAAEKRMMTTVRIRLGLKSMI